MFEIAELGQTLKKSAYLKQIPDLRTQLLLTQQQLKTCDFPVIILISGVDGGGKGEIINLLNEWLDARYLQTTAFDEPSDEERERPKFWRFWRTLPPKGSIGIYVGSWYSEPLSLRVYDKIDDNRLQVELNHINETERLLIDDGALIIKCWLHLKKETQKDRIKTLAKNPDTDWQVTERDKKHLKMYDDFIRVAEQALTETSTGIAPWLIVDGSDRRYSSFTVGQHILHRIQHHIDARAAQSAQETQNNGTLPINNLQKSLLDALDLSLKTDKKTYNEKLAHYQGKLSRLTRYARQQKRSSILVFEGMDAAGKGGAIRRLIHAMDARNCRVIPTAAPSDEERAQHYLWRFWRHIPRAGKVTLYDRSWYGRVLVERVEDFASHEEWMRAYAEIVNFEQALTDHGIILLKFWLHIDKDEQLRRFKEREQISYKQFKITEEDYRNREKWDDYKHAVNEMITRTSTLEAPWLLVEGNDKKYARIKILKAFCERLESALDSQN
ncbi:MAG: polyphosphate:AMP phosphotransferase [Gammaproteobacteria bacterium HGW-Gammaproteobacteria-10]|jgi:polyphosphate:AMP phosphotransferase|nr:MAG: polyphosphate:AMP phosphotransferase [Gammaproteobacteria bacterium HGW-Gammaproteobacteria-3]PKM35232.1 MAG: polyphosphate:AMP phosphotransferase [Gammaproteobacteria bacterium HGW-Gammaproteobacteria-10]